MPVSSKQIENKPSKAGEPTSASLPKALAASLNARQESWLVTGAVGFIGSNLVETLLKHGQRVRGLDNFSTGKRSNLDLVRKNVVQSAGEAAWSRFELLEGDIRDYRTCLMACSQIDRVLHEAALGSVPRSIEDPLLTNACNIEGFLNMLVAAKERGIRSFVYAASSSTYGDEPNLPKREERIGNPLSPYAVTKLVNELYAKVFASAYGFRSIGLRYFNIFGERQDPNGAYAAVIPKWFAAILRDEPVQIYGDGETSRDFCFIDNCVQANLLAATTENDDAWNQVYNVACGERTSLNQLFELIKEQVVKFHPQAADSKPEYKEFRAGDVRHSLADISLARKFIGYEPTYDIRAGLNRCSAWYAEHL